MITIMTAKTILLPTIRITRDGCVWSLRNMESNIVKKPKRERGAAIKSSGTSFARQPNPSHCA